MNHKYKKVKRKETAEARGFDVSQIYREHDEQMSRETRDETQAQTNKPKKRSNFQKAQLRLADRKKEKARREADCLKRQQEKEAKQKIYQAKKDKRYKTLKAKNKRGQPLMGGRIELLLEKIQESMT